MLPQTTLNSKSFDRLRGLLIAKGITAYLVGGCVRDLLADHEIGDIDLVVGSDPKLVGAEIEKTLGGHQFLLNKEHNAIRIIGIDDGRGPAIDVLPLINDISEDLARRDFTINSMAIPISGPDCSDNNLKVIDPYGGKRDLENSTIKAISPNVFLNDPIRLIRAARLAAKLGFTIDDETARLIKSHVNLISYIAGERVRDEFMKLLSQPKSCQNLRLLDNLQLLCKIVPELEETKGVVQPKEHHWNVFEHSIETVGQVETLFETSNNGSIFPYNRIPKFEFMDRYFSEEISDGYNRSEFLKLTALLHDISKPSTKTVEPSGKIRFIGHNSEGATVVSHLLEKYRFGRTGIDFASRMVLYHLRPSQMAEPGMMPSVRAIYRYFRDLGNAAIDTLYLNLGDYLAARGPELGASEWGAHCETIDHILKHMSTINVNRNPALIDGHVIMKTFGLQPGPDVGKLIELVNEAQASGEISSTHDAMGLIETSLGNGGKGA